jgi:hypothetical protein
MSRLPIETYFNEFVINQEEAYKNLTIELENENELFRNFFDFQQKLFLNHYPGVQYTFESNESIVLQAYWKSTHLLFSVNHLILHGDYGSARVLMRQIFEYLILGKYIYTIKDNQIADQWLNGNQFNLYDKIIKLLKVPDKKHFHNLWIMLSKLVHAGSSSIQIGIVKKADDDIILSYGINLILLCCKNHFLQKCFITNKLAYFTERYGKYKEENIELRKKLRYLEIKAKSFLGEDGIAVINDYKRNWEFKK